MRARGQGIRLIYSFNVNQNKIAITRIQVRGLLTTDIKGQSFQRSLIAYIKRPVDLQPPVHLQCILAHAQ